MVIAVRAHCNPLDIYIYIYINRLSARRVLKEGFQNCVANSVCIKQPSEAKF